MRLALKTGCFSFFLHLLPQVWYLLSALRTWPHVLVTVLLQLSSQLLFFSLFFPLSNKPLFSISFTLTCVCALLSKNSPSPFPTGSFTFLQELFQVTDPGLVTAETGDAVILLWFRVLNILIPEATLLNLFLFICSFGNILNCIFIGGEERPD